MTTQPPGEGKCETCKGLGHIGGEAACPDCSGAAKLTMANVLRAINRRKLSGTGRAPSAASEAEPYVGPLNDYPTEGVRDPEAGRVSEASILRNAREHVCRLWRQCRANPRPVVGEETALDDVLGFIDAELRRLRAQPGELNVRRYIHHNGEFVEHQDGDWCDYREAIAALSRQGWRSCTCHPDDNPPRPCPQKYALTDCREAASPANAAAGVEQGRWVPWKPGDALPATAPVLHWTTWFDKEFTDVPMMLANHAHDFERWGVIAYWSIPLPPPYSLASQPERGEGK